MEDITNLRVLVLSEHDDVNAPIIVEASTEIGTILSLVYVERDVSYLCWKIVEYSEHAERGYECHVIHEFKDRMVAVRVFNLLFEDSMSKWVD